MLRHTVEGVPHIRTHGGDTNPERESGLRASTGGTGLLVLSQNDYGAKPLDLKNHNSMWLRPNKKNTKL
jgi:hypothetical protein